MAGTGRADSFDSLRLLLDPLLDAMDYAHAVGVSHGAITPENVVFDGNDRPTLTDFGVFDPRNGARARYIPRQLLASDGKPTHRSDFYALYELYKEFLPARTDEAGIEARNRIIRNLSEAQLSTATSDELRYKLDAITRMADLLGFGSETAQVRPGMGPRLVFQLSPPTALVTPGSGTSVVLTVWNEGDQPLRIERVTSDVVWMNPQVRFEPVTLDPDDEYDLVMNVSAARLNPGAYATALTVFSNMGLATLTPQQGEEWHEQRVALPVLVQEPGVVPLAERLPPGAAPASASVAERTPAEHVSEGGDGPGIACIQDPDPGVIPYGRTGVLRVGVRNIGEQRLRIDKVATWPGWLAYPGFAHGGRLQGERHIRHQRAGE
jgi:hypothetical protein